jgi:hypothetical protein
LLGNRWIKHMVTEHPALTATPVAHEQAKAGDADRHEAHLVLAARRDGSIEVRIRVLYFHHITRMREQ